MGAPAGIAAAAGAQALSLGVLEGHGIEPSAQSGSSWAVPPKLRLVRKMLERAFLEAPRSRTLGGLLHSLPQASVPITRSGLNVDRSTWICEDRRWRGLAAAVHDPHRCRARTLLSRQFCGVDCAPERSSQVPKCQTQQRKADLPRQGLIALTPPSAIGWQITPWIRERDSSFATSHGNTVSLPMLPSTRIWLGLAE
jgi:hypothetical protein